MDRTTERMTSSHPSILVPMPDATVDDLHDRLRRAIIGNELGAREELSQVELAKRLGVSTTPLREALRMLQREGLVEAARNRRVRVSGLSIADMEDLYCARIPLEALALRLTVRTLDDAGRAELEGLYAQMAFFAAREDYEGFTVHHRAFHGALAAGAGERVRTMIAELQDHGERYRATYTLAIPRAWDAGQREHRAILDAVNSGDADHAAALLADHLSHTVLGVIAGYEPDHDPQSLRLAVRAASAPLEGAST